MIPRAGQTYLPSGAAEIRDDILTDLRLAAIARGVANPPIHPGTDWYLLASAVANIGLIQYSNISLAEKATSVLEAKGDDLDEIREAYGLPEVQPSPASGKLVVGIVAGAVTIPDGLQFVYPNGLRGKVSGAHIGVVDGGEVEVIAIDTGSATNLAGGESVTWASPPLNVKSQATVSIYSPLVGGLDSEKDERKRDRIMNRLQNVPQGGNPGYMIETSLNALASVQYAFVYSAIGGPSSQRVVVVRDFDSASNSWSRALTTGALDIVRQAIHAAMPDGMETVVSTVTEENADVALQVTIPLATSAGGNGQGWLDAAPWPPLVVADGGRVPIGTVTTSSQYTVTANTATAPVAGQTHVAWWNPTDKRFETRLVSTVGGASPNWVITLDAPWVDSNGATAQVGDYVCPAAVNLAAYGATWLNAMRRMGPGEGTADANRLPRAARIPDAADSWFADLGFQQLNTLVNAHAEITNAAYSYSPTTSPTVPGTVATAPAILVPRRFAVYKT